MPHSSEGEVRVEFERTKKSLHAPRFTSTPLISQLPRSPLSLESTLRPSSSNSILIPAPTQQSPRSIAKNGIYLPAPAEEGEKLLRVCVRLALMFIYGRQLI